MTEAVPLPWQDQVRVHVALAHKGLTRETDLPAPAVELVDQALDEVLHGSARCGGCRRRLTDLDRVSCVAVVKFSDATASTAVCFCRWCSSPASRLRRQVQSAVLQMRPNYEEADNGC